MWKDASDYQIVIELLMRLIIAAYLTATLLVACESRALLNSTQAIYESLDLSLQRISGSVIGDDSILFGENKTFPTGQCCDEMAAFGGHPNRIDLVIALDESGSAVFNFRTMKKFAEKLTSRFLVSYNATRVAIVAWSTQPTLEFGFDEYINNEGVKIGIDNIRYSGGWSATGDALHYIRTNLFSISPSNAKKILFVITGGESNSQSYDPELEAQEMKDDGVEIFAIGVGLTVNNSEIESIASSPTSSHAFEIKSFLSLSSLSNLISDTGCETGTTVHDACGRRCTCEDGKLIDCKRVRKNFLDMTDLERCRYLRTVKIASTVEPFKSEYDELIAMHEELFFTGIHGFQFFLPWHRWYILAYENILRKIDCRVTVPYWDWSLNPSDAWTSDVWNDNLCKHTGVGGNGVGDEGCVVTGPFAYPGWTMTPSTGNACLSRFFNGIPPDCTAVQDVLDATTAEFDDFLFGLEVLLHNTVHVRINGIMATVASSNAPEFFLHHGFVDKIWRDWQLKGLSYLRYEYYENTTAMPGTIYSPRDVYNLDDQPYYVRVHHDEPSQMCQVGGESLSMAEISAMSIPERVQLSPTPLPEISRSDLVRFSIPQSVIDKIPSIVRRLIGIDFTLTP